MSLAQFSTKTFAHGRLRGVGRAAGRVSLVWAALLGGCEGPPVSRMPAQTQAFEVVAAHLGPRLPAMQQAGRLTEPPVHWWVTPCPGTEQSAVLLGPRCYAGLFYRGDAIDVAWRGSFGESAYGHEVLHYLLGQDGDSDPDHQRLELWDAVQAADLALQERGL